jgi:hypothetical protein
MFVECSDIRSRLHGLSSKVQPRTRSMFFGIAGEGALS